MRYDMNSIVTMQSLIETEFANLQQPMKSVISAGDLNKVSPAAAVKLRLAVAKLRSVLGVLYEDLHTHTWDETKSAAEDH